MPIEVISDRQPLHRSGLIGEVNHIRKAYEEVYGIHPGLQNIKTQCEHMRDLVPGCAL
jgi:hypothetical protein